MAGIKTWTEGVPFDDNSRKQVEQTASLPFIHSHIAVMPDVHFGLGATVGTVIPTRGAVVPAAVGVDIGCGMMAQKTTLTAEDLPDSLTDLRHDIERGVPVGFAGHKSEPKSPERAQRVWHDMFVADYDNFIAPEVGLVGKKNPLLQLGTLGGGNHFIEVCLDESDNVWVMLHSGSRGVGNKIGQHFIERAKKEAGHYLALLPNKDLAFLTEDTPTFDAYTRAVSWAQDYALANRTVMMDAVLRSLSHRVKPFNIEEQAVSCHHNYIAREHHFGANVWVTRKGAVRARKGDLGIIPGSMGARSYIVEGLGNEDSFHTCSHGAGRTMSRKEAKRRFTVADHEKATDGIECRKDAGVIDETPGAYKDIDAVMEAQKDLVKIKHRLRQVLCVKG